MKLLIAAILVSSLPLAAQEDGSITDYTSTDGRLRFSYPEDWIVDEDAVWQFILVTAAPTDSDRAVTAFSLITMRCRLMATLSGLACPNRDFESLIQAFLQQKGDFYGFTLLQEPFLLALENYPAMAMRGRSDSPNDVDTKADQDRLWIVVGLTDNDFAVLEGFTPVGEMDEAMELFLSVADSLVLNPVD
jgi:hypothetical protein